MSATTKVDIIIDGIRSRILSGEFGQDGRLPSFRKLVDEYETSQETMNKAMQALQAEGLLLSAGAKGVFVNSSRIRMPGIVVDFAEYLEKQGLKSKSEFIAKPEIITPSLDIQKRLKLKKGQQVLFRQRKQGSEQTPFRIAFEYFPLHLLNETILEEIYKNPGLNVLETIKKTFDKAVGFTQEELIVRLPTSFEQEHLQIVRTNPVIESQRNHLTKDKKTVLLYNKKVLNANHFLLSYDYSADQWR